MQIQQNVSLRQYNTFGIDAIAKGFVEFHSLDDLQTLFNSNAIKEKLILVLGGGSNILFTKNFEGLVLKNNIYGIETVHEEEKDVYVKAGAGENWHKFVLHCIDRNFGGVENLSLIPGNVGAAPMQNIGAYGVEIKDIFHSLEAYNFSEKKIMTFTLNDCDFGYRESIFKKKYKDQFAILNVTFRLSKKPVFSTSYGAIEEQLQKMDVKELSIKAISDAVISIRTSKLPDPSVIGNAGSFFKNPEISATQLEELQNIAGEDLRLPFYKLHDNNFKIPAGWLIEQCGWKGYRKRDAGCYEKQALVLVNYGSATGNEILELSGEIKKSVKDKFLLQLETEVNIV
jgi:UDP-N-acetylmuramate dehydrogenase